jgi:hypothetical protein
MTWKKIPNPSVVPSDTVAVFDTDFHTALQRAYLRYYNSSFTLRSIDGHDFDCWPNMVILEAANFLSNKQLDIDGQEIRCCCTYEKIGNLSRVIVPPGGCPIHDPGAYVVYAEMI